MIFHFITSNVSIFLLCRKSAFRISAWTMEWRMHYHILENFLWGAHDSFFRSYSQKTEKIESFQGNFFVPILTYFANQFILTSDFFTALSHLYSLHHDIVVLFLSHLRSELEIFFLFLSKKWLKIIFLNWYIFPCINVTLRLPPQSLSWECSPIHL